MDNVYNFAKDSRVESGSLQFHLLSEMDQIVLKQSTWIGCTLYRNQLYRFQPGVFKINKQNNYVEAGTSSWGN